MLPYVLDLFGVAVFAISGALAAGRKGMDLLGVLVLAMVTAIGGGTIRDVLVDRQPIFWLFDRAYLIVILAAAMLTVAWVRWGPSWRFSGGTVLLIADALGLALFAVSGAQVAERVGLPPFAGIVLGTITGAAGGALRDVLSAEVPMILQRGNLYASAAIAGTGTYFLLVALGAPRPMPTLVGMGVVAGVRLASIWWRLHLPVFRIDGDGRAHREGDDDR